MDAVHHKAKQNTAPIPLAKRKHMKRKLPKLLNGVMVWKHYETDEMYVTAHFEDGTKIDVPQRGTIEETIEQILNLD